MLLFFLSILGCAPRWHWAKRGATQQDFMSDSYECERDARQSGYFGQGMYGLVNFQLFQERCLMARGYYKEQNR
jgi:hypothetical protein